MQSSPVFIRLQSRTMCPLFEKKQMRQPVLSVGFLGAGLAGRRLSSYFILICSGLESTASAPIGSMPDSFLSRCSSFPAGVVEAVLFLSLMS